MRYYVYLLLLCSSFLVYSCKHKAIKEHTSIKGTIQVTDDMGRIITIPSKPERIVSLTPSITELLYAFTDTTYIAGRSSFCDYPIEVISKPAVNSYPVDIEGIVRLKPDLVLVMKGMISIQDLEKLEQLSIPVFIQKYDRLTEIENSVRTLVRITNGDSLKMETWLATLHTDSSKAIRRDNRFIILASVNPIYIYGKQTFASELAEQAGGTNAIDSVSNAYPSVDVEYFLRTNPDKLIFNSGTESASFFETYPVLKKIKAYKRNQLYTIDASILSRPGSRLPLLKDTLMAIIHP